MWDKVVGGILASETFSAPAVVDVCQIPLFLDTLSLASRSPLRHCLGHEGHKLASRPPLVEAERRQVVGTGENGRTSSICCCLEDGNREHFHDD